MIGRILKTLFPRVLAAVEAREQHKSALDGRDLWAVGDALIAECGAPRFDVETRSANDGSHKKLKQCSSMLLAHGHKNYGITALVNLRDTAQTFKGRRHQGISLWVHQEAGSPDFMDWIVEKHGTGRRGGAGIGVPEIRKLRKHWKQIERQQRREKYEAAKEEERTAPTPHAKEKARERVEELRGMPEPSSRTLPRPDRESVAELQIMSDNLDLSAQSESIVRELQNQLKTIDSMKDGIHPDFIDAFEETYKEADKILQQIRQRLERSRLKIFKTIQGGKAS